MSLTLTDLSKMSEPGIAAMLEFDNQKALEFVSNKIAEFESKYVMSTEQMLKQYNPDDSRVEGWMEDWHDLAVMRTDLISDNVRTKV